MIYFASNGSLLSAPDRREHELIISISMWPPIGSVKLPDRRSGLPETTFAGR